MEQVLFTRDHYIRIFFQAQAEGSYFSSDYRLKIFLYYNKLYSRTAMTYPFQNVLRYHYTGAGLFVLLTSFFVRKKE